MYNVNLRQNLDFFKSETSFSKQFCPKICLFSVLNFRMEPKKLLKTEHQCAFVYIMNFTNFRPFWGFFAALRPSLSYFYNFFRGSEVCLERCDSHGNFGFFFNKFFLLLENFVKRTHCPHIVTMALLLFIIRFGLKYVILALLKSIFLHARYYHASLSIYSTTLPSCPSHMVPG